MSAALTLSQDVGKKAAVDAFALSRATFYRYFKPKTEKSTNRPAPPLALSPREKQDVIDTLHSSRFQDRAPHQVFATLLDEGKYLCSIRTMYRILQSIHGSVRERRKHTSRTHYQKPELIAERPNEVWSWDITKLKGPVKWTYFYLYAIIDIFSRLVVGWLIAPCEKTSLAKRLIEESILKQNIHPGQLTVHADRGSSMKSKGVANLLADLGITKTHSRPYVSNDNPFSEAQFKTLKYCPAFPDRFGSIEDARLFCRGFFDWYNKEHKHTGIALLTPEQVHYGQSRIILQNRSAVLKEAFLRYPKRFKHIIPKPNSLPDAVWINKPSESGRRPHEICD